MVTYHDHLKNILVQIFDSYNHLKEVKDNPGDLINIKKEMLKINGFLKVITNKPDFENIPLSDFKPLKSKFQHYLQKYSFEQEIETMIPLYSDDVHRIKNMRLKILEALEGKKMMDEIMSLIEKNMTDGKKCILCGCKDHKLLGCSRHISKKCSCYKETN